MSAPVQDHEMVREARQHTERALSYINSLHLGPLDFNVAEAIDALQVATKALDAFRQQATLS